MVDKLTFIAELRDKITGPAGKAQRSVEDLGKATETAGKDADKAYGKAGKAAEDHARKTATSTGKVERALQDLTGSTRRTGQQWKQTWDDAEKGPRRAAEELSTAGQRMETDSRRIGQNVGRNLSTGIQNGIDNIDVSGIATALGGLTVGAGVMGSLSRGTTASRIAAAEGVDAGAVRALTEEAYGAGWGRDYESLSMSAGSVVATFDIEPGSAEAERLLSGTATLDEVFGLGPDQLTMAAKIIADNDGISAEAAQDILGQALQDATAAGRDEMVDNLQEYVPFLNDTGMSAAALATMLSEATGRGPMASDRTGDAIKEFSVRAIDTGSKAYADAYAELGMDQADVSRRLQSGDATVMSDVAQALRDMPDPVERANLAKEIFGTPFEDIGVGNFDDQLRAWSELDLSMQGAEGSIARMQDTLQDDRGREWEKAMRDLSGAMIDVGDAAAPLISAVAPIISWLAKPLAWGATGLTLYGIMSRIPGLAGAAQWAVRGLWRMLAFTPLGRLVTFVGLAVSGLGELYDNSEKVRAVFDGITDAIRDLVDMFDDLLGRADDWASKKLGLENNGGAAEVREMQEADIRPQWWKDATRGMEETIGWGPQSVQGEGWLRFLQGAQDDGDLPHHAEGGWTASGAHKAVLGEQGREFVINNWASEKLASVPGALPAISQGKLPTLGVPLPVNAGGAGAVSIGALQVYTNATDGAEFARQFAVEFPRHFQAATARQALTKELTYSTLTERGAR